MTERAAVRKPWLGWWATGQLCRGPSHLDDPEASSSPAWVDPSGQHARGPARDLLDVLRGVAREHQIDAVFQAPTTPRAGQGTNGDQAGPAAWCGSGGGKCGGAAWGRTTGFLTMDTPATAQPTEPYGRYRATSRAGVVSLCRMLDPSGCLL